MHGFNATGVPDGGDAVLIARLARVLHLASIPPSALPARLGAFRLDAFARLVSRYMTGSTIAVYRMYVDASTVI